MVIYFSVAWAPLGRWKKKERAEREIRAYLLKRLNFGFLYLIRKPHEFS